MKSSRGAAAALAVLAAGLLLLLLLLPGSTLAAAADPDDNQGGVVDASKAVAGAAGGTATSLQLQSPSPECRWGLPVNFTYYQRPRGYYCQVPNRYLQATYGISFNSSSSKEARPTTDPRIWFAVVEVRTAEDWNELGMRLLELDLNVSRGVHTPSLFWDGRTDAYWHADATEDTISGKDAGHFQSEVDSYVDGCLAAADGVAESGGGGKDGLAASNSDSENPAAATAPAGGGTLNANDTAVEDGDGCSIEAADTAPSGGGGGDAILAGQQQAAVATTKNGATTTACFSFFYSRGCPHCAAVREYVDDGGGLAAEVAAGLSSSTTNSSFRYEAYDVHVDDNSRKLLLAYDRFGYHGDQKVPTIFFGREGGDGDGNNGMAVLVGESAIYESLAPLLRDARADPPPCYDFDLLGVQVVDASENPLNWGVLTAAALVDSINPCAIAVLLILLGGLVMSVVPPTPAAAAAAAAAAAEEVNQNPSPPGDDKENPSNAPADGEEASETNNGEETLASEEEEVAGRSSEDEGPTSVEEEPKVVDVELAAGEQGNQEDSDVPIEAGTGTDGAPKPPTDAERGQPGADAAAGNDAAGSSQRSKARRAFFSGMAFILAVFLAYYALGFGIFAAVSSTQVSSIILLVLGIFVIFLGLWNLKDYLCYEKGYNVEIPRSWRPVLKRFLGAVTSPIGAFGAGFVVCLFELPCTGGPYLFILGLLADKNTRAEAAFLLLYYNFIFVLPLIVINCLVFWGVSTLEKVGSWKEKYIRHLHLFAGLVLIALGVLAVVDSQIPLF